MGEVEDERYHGLRRGQTFGMPLDELAAHAYGLSRGHTFDPNHGMGYVQENDEEESAQHNTQITRGDTFNNDAIFDSLGSYEPDESERDVFIPEPQPYCAPASPEYPGTPMYSVPGTPTYNEMPDTPCYSAPGTPYYEVEEPCEMIHSKGLHYDLGTEAPPVKLETNNYNNMAAVNTYNEMCTGANANKRGRDEIEPYPYMNTQIPQSPGNETVVSTGTAQKEAGENSAMGLYMYMDLYRVIPGYLTLNRRRERDWDSLSKTLFAKCTWAERCLKSNTLLKGKMKAILQERRSRPQISFWKKLLGDKSLTVELLERMLRSRAGAAPEGANWDFSVIARYLMELLQKKAKSPGQLLDWPEPVSQDFIDKMLAVHRQCGYNFYDVYLRFKDLLTLGQVECAVLKACTCEMCEPWGLQPFSKDNSALILEWTKRRVQVMDAALSLHSQLGNCTMDTFQRYLMQSDEDNLQLIKHWQKIHLNAFLESAHSNKFCEVCNSSKRMQRDMHFGVHYTRSGCDEDEEDEDASDTETDEHEGEEELARREAEMLAAYKASGLADLSLDSLATLEEEEEDVVDVVAQMAALAVAN